MEILVAPCGIEQPFELHQTQYFVTQCFAAECLARFGMQKFDMHRYVHQCAFECLREVRVVEQSYRVFLGGDDNLACALQAVISLGDEFEVVTCIVVVIIEDVDLDVRIKTLDIAYKWFRVGYTGNNKYRIVGCELFKSYGSSAKDGASLFVGVTRVKQPLIRNQVEVLAKGPDVYGTDVVRTLSNNYDVGTCDVFADSRKRP